MSTNEKKGPQTAKSGAREENIGGRHYNMAGQPSPVVQAKARITITDAWDRLALPGHYDDGRSPWREDKKAGSFTVFADGKRFRDYSTGERGDVVEFIEKAAGVSKSEAAKMLIAWANTGNSGGFGGSIVRKPIAPRPVQTEIKPSPLDLRKPTDLELVRIGQMRKLPESYGRFPGLDLAVQRDLLWMSDVFCYSDHQKALAWVVTDGAGIGAQARRMDGKKWLTKAQKWTKAKNPRGFKASWPIGAANFGTAQNIILTEGAGDMLAAISAVYLSNGQDMAHVKSIGFACVGGADQDFHPESLAHFKGRRVRIVPDNDENGTGCKGAQKWTEQLTRAGATVEWFTLTGLLNADGLPAKDLNEVTFYAKDDGWNEPELPQWMRELADFGSANVEVSA